MSWRYRVMKHEPQFGDDVPYFAIHEVYSNPPGWTGHVPVGGESIEELRTMLKEMGTALDQPILDGKTGEEVHGDR